MKDPNDKNTVDGFASLVTQLDDLPSAEPLPDRKPTPSLAELAESAELWSRAIRGKPKKRGRKPIGKVAMTAAEKQKVYRDRQREAAQAEPWTPKSGRRATMRELIDYITAEPERLARLEKRLDDLVARLEEPGKDGA